MSETAENDVIVVGGGPAGATTASLLARQGRSVLILDRADFPRSKACGESVNPGAVAELGRLGLLPDVLRLPHRPVRGWNIHPVRGAPFTGAFPGNAGGLAVDRAPFDELLVERAVADGADLRTGVRVTEILREDGVVVGVRDQSGAEHRSRFVVGADGLRSVVMRRLGLRGRLPALLKIGLTSHVEDAGGGSEEGELFLLPWGCAGLVRIDDRLTNVVLIVERREERQVGEPSGAWFERLSAQVPALARARRVGPIHATGPFDYPTRGVTADGALLVGDAAGYYDPFTGQGIYRALKGARLAAEAIEQCLSRPETATIALGEYSRRHHRAFDGGVRLQKIIAAVTSRPALLGAVAGGVRLAPVLGDLLVGLTGDLRGARAGQPHGA